jgi:hypothetical protein
MGIQSEGPQIKKINGAALVEWATVREKRNRPQDPERAL